MLGARRCIAGDPTRGPSRVRQPEVDMARERLGAFARWKSRVSGFPISAQKEFTEPVALSSTRPADRPLPRRACELSFDLLALRARCKREPRGHGLTGQAAYSPDCRNLRAISSRGHPMTGTRRIRPCAA